MVIEIPRRWVSQVAVESSVGAIAKVEKFAGACSGGKFVVSGAGEAYDAHAESLNRKFLLRL